MLRQGDTGDWVGTFEGHKGAVWGVDLNSDASKAATGAADFSAKIWNATTGQEELTFKHRHIVKSVNFNRSGDNLATGSNDKLLRIFDVKEESEPIVSFKGHESLIKQVLFCEQGQALVSCADDKTLRFWDVRTGDETAKIDLTGPIGGMELAREEDVLTVAHGNQVSFFDMQK